VSEAMRWTVPERRGPAFAPTGWTYHLADGRWDNEALYQPVRCGGGITLPHQEKVPLSKVCPDCRAGVKTL